MQKDISLIDPAFAPRKVCAFGQIEVATRLVISKFTVLHLSTTKFTFDWELRQSRQGIFVSRFCYQVETSGRTLPGLLPVQGWLCFLWHAFGAEGGVAASAINWVKQHSVTNEAQQVCVHSPVLGNAVI